MYLTEIGVLMTLMTEISFSKSTYVFFSFSSALKNCLPIHVINGFAATFSISIIQIISFQDNHGQKQHLGQATGGLKQGNVTADQPKSQLPI